MYVAMVDVPAVVGGGLVGLGGDALHPRQDDDHREADVLPGDDPDQGPDGDLRVREPVRLQEAQPQLLQHVVQRAARLQHERPAGADDDLGDDVRHEQQDPDHRLAAHLAVQQEGEQDRHRALDHEGEDHEERVVPQRGAEFRVREDGDVVLQADELRRRPEALPAVEAVVSGHHDREDDERDEDDQRRAGQDRDLQPGAPVDATRAPTRGQRDRRTAPARHRVRPGWARNPRAIPEGCHRTAPQAFLAALLTAWTMASGPPLPASMLTTPTLSALPTFWPYSVSSHWDTNGAAL